MWKLVHLMLSHVYTVKITACIKIFHNHQDTFIKAFHHFLKPVCTKSFKVSQNNCQKCFVCAQNQTLLSSHQIIHKMKTQCSGCVAPEIFVFMNTVNAFWVFSSSIHNLIHWFIQHIKILSHKMDKNRVLLEGPIISVAFNDAINGVKADSFKTDSSTDCYICTCSLVASFCRMSNVTMSCCRENMRPSTLMW